MARAKSRECYGNGSVSPELGKDGKQKKNRNGQLAWRICISLGTEKRVGKDGKQYTHQNKKQQIFYGTLAEARDACKKLSQQYEHIDISASDKTFADACKAWETSMRNAATASENCLASYLRNLAHMSRHIGNKTLVSISKQDIEDALATIKNERRLSNTTLHKVFAVTKRVFTYAVDSDWMVRNPCSKIKAPKIDEVTNRHSLSADECARLRVCLDKAEAEALDDFQAKESRQLGWGNTFGRSCLRGLSELSCIIALRIELATGLRRSEVLGLDWSSVDFENNQITVRQKLIVERKRGEKTDEDNAIKIRKPKTKSGIRTLYVDVDTMAHLKRWKAFQASVLHLVMPDGKALSQTEKTPVCVGDNGSWLRPSSISRWWGTSQAKGFRDRIGFGGLNMHELRHSQATLLLSSGVDLKTVQVRMGHAKSSHTLDLYAHAMPACDKSAADIMGAICNAASQPSASIVKLGKTA